jgi:hypothetical protein
MTTPTPTPEKQNPPDAPDSEPTKVTGFFNRVQRELHPEPVHPTEAAEIVIMDEGESAEDSDDATLMEEVSSLLTQLQTPESIPSDQM